MSMRLIAVGRRCCYGFDSKTVDIEEITKFLAHFAIVSKEVEEIVELNEINQWSSLFRQSARRVTVRDTRCEQRSHAGDLLVLTRNNQRNTCSLINKLKYWLTHTASGPMYEESHPFSGLLDICATYATEEERRDQIIQSRRKTYDQTIGNFWEDNAVAK